MPHLLVRLFPNGQTWKMNAMCMCVARIVLSFERNDLFQGSLEGHRGKEVFVFEVLFRKPSQESNPFCWPGRCRMHWYSGRRECEDGSAMQHKQKTIFVAHHVTVPLPPLKIRVCRSSGRVRDRSPPSGHPSGVPVRRSPEAGPDPDGDGGQDCPHPDHLLSDRLPRHFVVLLCPVAEDLR